MDVPLERHRLGSEDRDLSIRAKPWSCQGLGEIPMKDARNVETRRKYGEMMGNIYGNVPGKTSYLWRFDVV